MAGKQKREISVYIVGIVILCVCGVLQGCSSKGKPLSAERSAGTGSVSFSLQWPENVYKASAATPFAAAGESINSIDCAALGVVKVEAVITDAQGTELGRGSWACSEHKGTIHDIPEGSNRQIVVTAFNADNIKVYEGNKAGITIVADQDNPIGPIDMYPAKAWGTSQLLESDNAGTAEIPQVAIDPDGNAIAVWRQLDGIWSNRYTPASGWGTAELCEKDVYQGSPDNPQVAMDPDGNAIAVWDQWGDANNIWSNRYTPASGWGTAGLLEVNAEDAWYPQVAIDPNGNAIAVWEQGGHFEEGAMTHIWANRYTPASGWGTAELIETDNAGDHQPLYSIPQVAIDPDGNAIAVWQQYDGTRYNIWANRYIPASGWGTAELIETDNAGDAEIPQVAMGPDGNAIVVWVQSDGIWSNRYTPASGWAAAGFFAGIAVLPQVAIDSNGNAIVVWVQSDGIWSNRYTPASGWGTARRIEGNAENVWNPQVAINPDGDAIVVWQQSDGTRDNLWANRYTPASGWGRAECIEGNAENVWNPQVAIDPDGNAIAVWEQWDGTRYNIWSNRFE